MRLVGYYNTRQSGCDYFIARFFPAQTHHYNPTPSSRRRLVRLLRVMKRDRMDIHTFATYEANMNSYIIENKTACFRELVQAHSMREASNYGKFMFPDTSFNVFVATEFEAETMSVFWRVY